MVTSQTVVESVVSLIDTNIADINTERADKGLTWVYDDADRIDVEGYPRVRVICPTSISEPFGLGCVNTQRFKPRIEIQVRVKKTDKYLINSESKAAPFSLDHLSKLITDVLSTGSARSTLLSDTASFYFELEAENNLYGEILTRQLIYKGVLKR